MTANTITLAVLRTPSKANKSMPEMNATVIVLLNVPKRRVYKFGRILPGADPAFRIAIWAISKRLKETRFDQRLSV